jgi:N-acetylneuraminic acid mutarotase
MNGARLVLFGGLALMLAGCEPEAPEPEDMEAFEEPAGWTILAEVPEARTEVSVTTDGERIYMIGGFLEAEGDERPPAARDMYVYDPVTDEWENYGEIPGGTHHAAFVHVDGRLYVLGGYIDNSFDPADQVWIYDIDAGEWSEGTPMPTPRGALAYTVLDGKIHTIGGTVEDIDALEHEQHNTDSPDSSVGTHEVYDPANDDWTRHAPMPTVRNHHVAKAVDGRIVVTAGRAGRDFTMTVTEIYDPETDDWTEGAPLPTGRSGVAGERLDGWVYVFGGETFDEGAERTFSEAERYDIHEDVWDELVPMPTARHGLGAAVVDGRIYVISGGPGPGFTFGTANERFSPGG